MKATLAIATLPLFLSGVLAQSTLSLYLPSVVLAEGTPLPSLVGSLGGASTTVGYSFADAALAAFTAVQDADNLVLTQSNANGDLIVSCSLGTAAAICTETNNADGTITTVTEVANAYTTLVAAAAAVPTTAATPSSTTVSSITALPVAPSITTGSSSSTKPTTASFFSSQTLSSNVFGYATATSSARLGAYVSKALYGVVSFMVAGTYLLLL